VRVQEFVELAHKLADAAGEITTKFFRTGVNVESKADASKSCSLPLFSEIYRLNVDMKRWTMIHVALMVLAPCLIFKSSSLRSCSYSWQRFEKGSLSGADSSSFHSFQAFRSCHQVILVTL
jgi:hypothetical protein